MKDFINKTIYIICGSTGIGLSTARLLATSVAGLLLTTEIMVADIPEDKKPLPGAGGGMPHGMDDMM